MGYVEKTPGQIAYEAWAVAEITRGRKPDPPLWEHVPDDERASWHAGGDAVRADTFAEFDSPDSRRGSDY